MCRRLWGIDGCRAGAGKHTFRVEVCAVVADSAFSNFRSVAYDREGYFVGAGGSVWRESSEERSDSSRPRWVSSTPAGATAWICGEPTRWNAVRSSAVPVLLIHGTEDINILPWHSRVLAQADPAHAQLWLVPGARHCGAVGSGLTNFGLECSFFSPPQQRRSCKHLVESGLPAEG